MGPISQEFQRGFGDFHFETETATPQPSDDSPPCPWIEARAVMGLASKYESSPSRKEDFSSVSSADNPALWQCLLEFLHTRVRHFRVVKVQVLEFAQALEMFQSSIRD